MKEDYLMNPNQSLNSEVEYDFSLLSEDDLYLFNEGKHFNLYNKLGAHLVNRGKKRGVYFAVWAPNAGLVSVIGNFNQWNAGSHLLKLRGKSGIWEGFIPGLQKGEIYKYHILSNYQGYEVNKADPLAFYAEKPPLTASIIWETDFNWQDQKWMAERKDKNSLKAPISIYELHLGSWRCIPEEGNRPLTYRELAPVLADYIQKMGFTHVELLPVMEHPFYGSWGYQITGYFSPTSRYGTPQDFMFLIDYLHQVGIAVILDWVPSHFPRDKYGLFFFDGTHLYEHADPRQGYHPDWSSSIYNYGKNEVQAFLISSALFWLDIYHADGLRVDGVASMLYLDYSRKPGEWIPNKFGGKENLEALAFIKTLNQQVYKYFPDVQTIAEESTSWPMVSRPTHIGGLGFGLKWDMGWMHDVLYYMSKDSIYRKFHHNELTFRMLYAFSENFVLPLSHDEVVHEKRSLIGRMPGNDNQKFANMRLLYSYMFAQPGKKMIFMGGEFGQWHEWNHDESLDWHLLTFSPHANLQKWLSDLNFKYRTEKALYELDCESTGFKWIDCTDIDHSTLSILRKSSVPGDEIIIALNFTPVPLFNYKIGAPVAGEWLEILNSDAMEYGGSGYGNQGKSIAENKPYHGQPCSLSLTLPPLGAIFFKSNQSLQKTNENPQITLEGTPD
jgi:1,4-alpha-glucan branching enzyme